MTRRACSLVAVLFASLLLALPAPAHAEDEGVYDMTVDRNLYPASGSMTATWRTVVPDGVSLWADATCTLSWGGVTQWSGTCHSGEAFSYDVGSVGYVSNATLQVRIFYSVPGDFTLVHFLDGERTTGFDGQAPTAGVTGFLTTDLTAAPNPMRPATVYVASLTTHDNVDVATMHCSIERVTDPVGPVKDVTCSDFSTNYFTTPGESGTYKYVVVATDPAGNSTTGSRTFAVDATGPVVTFDSGPADGSATKAANASWTWHADEPATYRCGLAAAGITPTLSTCTSPYTSTALGEGDYDFVVEATDGYANVSTTTVGFTIDRSKPALTVTTGPANGATVTSTKVAYGLFSGSDVVTFECWWGSDTQLPNYSPCVSGQVFTLPGNGTYVFAFRATDAAGNVSDEVLRTVTVALDTTAPKVRVIGQPAKKVHLAKHKKKVTSKIKLSTSEVGTVYYRVDDGTWKKGALSLKVKAGKGKHTVRAYVVDAAGNQSLTVAVKWKVLAPKA